MAFAYLMYPLLYYIGDESTWFNLTVLGVGLVFDTFSKEWRLEPRKERSAVKDVAIYTVCVLVFVGLLASYFYFNATLTDSEGEEIKLAEAVKHFFTSPMWLDLKVNF